jgi:hypothetical protein
MAALQRGNGFAAPRNATQEYRQHRLLLPQRLQELGDVVEQAAKARRVTARLSVLPGAAAIKKRHGEPRLAEPLAGMLIPAGMALNAMHENNPAARRAGGRIVAVMTAVAVADGVRFQSEDGEPP